LWFLNRRALWSLALQILQVFIRGSEGKLVFFDVAAIAVHPGIRPNSGQQDWVSIDLPFWRLAKPLSPEFKPVELTDSFQNENWPAFTYRGFGIATKLSGDARYLRTGVSSP